MARANATVRLSRPLVLSATLSTSTSQSGNSHSQDELALGKQRRSRCSRYVPKPRGTPSQTRVFTPTQWTEGMNPPSRQTTRNSKVIFEFLGEFNSRRRH